MLTLVDGILMVALDSENSMIIRRTTSEKELLLELEQFEHQFGVPSERMAEAFTVNGRLEETPAFARWSLVYAAHKRAAGLASSTG